MDPSRHARLAAPLLLLALLAGCAGTGASRPAERGIAVVVVAEPGFALAAGTALHFDAGIAIELPSLDEARRDALGEALRAALEQTLPAAGLALTDETGPRYTLRVRLAAHRGHDQARRLGIGTTATTAAVMLAAELSDTYRNGHTPWRAAVQGVAADPASIDVQSLQTAVDLVVERLRTIAGTM